MVSKIKYILLTLVVFLVLLSIESIGFAESSFDQTDVDPHHDWTIKFNAEVDDRTIKGNIYVEDYSGTKINVNIYPNSDKYLVTVEAPKEGYRVGDTYFLFINNEVSSLKGTKLKNDLKMQFSIIQHQDEKLKIINKWEQYKPTFEGNPFNETPSITHPYTVGSVKQEFLNDGLKMTNFVRFLAGLPDDLVLDQELNINAQHGAVVTAANGRLSHYPAKPVNMDESFFDVGYKSASSSNLSQQYTRRDFTSTYEVENYIQMGTLEGTVYSYMMDEDASNIDRVGHRRWILNPSLKKVGFGFAINENLNNHYYYTFSPMQVFDESRIEPVEYDFIGWPGKGYFPNEFFQNDVPWSVSLNPTKYQAPDINKVKVELTRVSDGQKWILDKNDNNIKANNRNVIGEYFNINNQWYGIPYCIVFRPDPNIIQEYLGKYDVVITGVNDINGSSTSIKYTVDFFDMLN